MTTETVEVRIQRMEDERALAKLINNYHKCADRFDWAAWAESFTEDSVFVFPTGFGTMTGKQAIHDICKGSMDHVYEVMQHVMVNLDFAVDGDKATGTGNLIFVGIMKADQPTSYFMTGGRYQWEFSRTAAGWRIARTYLEFIWNNGGDEDAVFKGE